MFCPPQAMNILVPYALGIELHICQPVLVCCPWTGCAVQYSTGGGSRGPGEVFVLTGHF